MEHDIGMDCGHAASTNAPTKPEINTGDKNKEAAELLAKQSNIDNVELKEEFVVVKINDANVDYSFIPQLLLQNGYRLRMFREEELSLEDAFMVLTKGITN